MTSSLEPSLRNSLLIDWPYSNENMYNSDCYHNKDLSIENAPKSELLTSKIITQITEETNKLEPTESKSETTYEIEKPGISGMLKKAFWVGLGLWSSYNLFDSGLARFLALETLTHGTGPLGYLGISLNGADPNFGGGKTGSSVASGMDHYIKNSRNYFYVFKDSEFVCGHIGEELGDKIACGFMEYFPFSSSLSTRLHSTLSGMSNFGFPTATGLSQKIRGIVGGIAGFLTPTLKARFKPEEVCNCIGDFCRFENDPDYGGLAYRTAQPISPTHLGVTGSLKEGINTGIFGRMFNHPGKVLIGAALLGAAFLTARATYRYIKAEPTKKEISTQEKEVSRAQYWKQKAKNIAIGTGWLAFAATTLFLNTL